MSPFPFRYVPALAISVSLAIGAAGCSATQPPPSRPTSPGVETSAPETPTREPTSTTQSTPTPAPLASLRVTLEPVATGFSQPLWVTDARDGSGRLWVVEQGGRVWVLEKGRRAAKPFLDVRRAISSGGERGLLGLAFAPDYRTSGRFYVNYTDRRGATVIARYTADDPASSAPKITGPKMMLRIAQPYANHNGGCIVFGPDGKLWVGMGDGGSGGDPQDRAQDPKSRLGKMLRLDVSGAQVRVETVQSGLRNPWRFSFDRDSGDLWIGDVGQSAWEEIDRVPIAQADAVNWGWNRWEGTHPYPAGSSSSREGFVFPIHEYPHPDGGSVTGGYVYRGDDSPGLWGAYLYGDFVKGWMEALRVDASGSVVERRRLVTEGIVPASFGEDEDGELYLVDYAGRILRIRARTP